jgi:hypothetical protein
MLKEKQVSPRTYMSRKKELEQWVTKEKEEIIETKKVFEEQWKKTANIIEETQRNAELMKKVFLEQKPNSTQFVAPNLSGGVISYLSP